MTIEKHTSLISGYLAVMIGFIFLFALQSCSDVTSLSKEQIKQFKKSKVMIIGLGDSVAAKAPPPLMVVNGKIISDKSLLTKIQPDNINSIKILKDEAAIKAYGRAAKGKAGVIEINMDKKSFKNLMSKYGPGK
jgi:hypothetical protein